jgi:uncharacterized membrane protein
VNEISSPERQRVAERAVWSLVWLAILTTGVNEWGQWSSWSGMAVLTPLLVLAGVAGATLLWSVRDPGSRAMQHLGFAAAMITVALTQGVGIATRLFYSTDSAAFNQVATQQLLRGQNPYTSSMNGAAQLLPAASNYWTYTLSGGHVNKISYPAGSFLLQAPLQALGVHHLASDWLDLAAWLVTIAILYRVLPARVRWLAPLLLLTDAFVGPFANGGTDALFVPFLVLSVWRWDRFVSARQSTLASWLSPVALGVACSIKQSPWICVPFLLVGVALESRARNASAWAHVLQYALKVAGAFLVVNLTFIVWSPQAWLHGSLLPLLNPLVPDGQGLVTIALHGLSGGVGLKPLLVASGFVALALLVAYGLWYRTMKLTWLFLVPLVLFVPGRSLTSYLIDFFPVAIVAAVTVRRVDRPTPVTLPAWAQRLSFAAPLVAAGIAATVAFTSVPLSVAVDSVATLSAHQAIGSITLTVTNTSSERVTPHFMVSFGGGHPSGFWSQSLRRGSLPLAPGHSATITIRPLVWTWAPQYRQNWLVDAYTSSPAALSTSTLQRWPYPPTP